MLQPKAHRVAILDNDSGFVQVLSKRIERMGWEGRAMPTAGRAQDLVAMRLHSAVVDPRIFGPRVFAELEQLRATLPNVALVVCTGPSTVSQRVRGLRLGADDWVSKPCHPEEVMARLEAVLRRRTRSSEADQAPLHRGELEIRPDHFQAYVSGGSADLTRREFELLVLLASAEGRVLEREEIYERLWGYAMARGDRSVDVFVRKLRLKLMTGSPDWRYIHTHFGVGYRFAPEPLSDASADPKDDLGSPPPRVTKRRRREPSRRAPV